jgi:hypothetical protein
MNRDRVSLKKFCFLWLKPLVDALITDRILAFYRNLIAKGQIKEVPANGPAVD